MLFGHQNDDANQPIETPPEPPAELIQPDTDGVNPLAVDPATGVSLPAAQADEPADASTSVSPVSSDDAGTAPAVVPTNADDDTATDDTAAVAADNDDDSPTGLAPAASDPAPSAAPTSGDLLGLKQQALSNLGPLVSHLDQTPEEKFRTTMMLIQSTDNQSLLPSAYEAAQAISDDKARAQALLDVVNEINYFTQQKQD